MRAVAFYILAAVTVVVYLRYRWHLEGYSWRTFFADTWRRLTPRWNWRTVLRSVCERGIETADAADERAVHASPKVIVKIREQWESRQPVEVMRTQDGIVVFAGSRFLRIKR